MPFTVPDGHYRRKSNLMTLSSFLKGCTVGAASLLLSCKDLTLTDQSYQRVHVANFSVPIRSLMPGRETYPGSMTLRVSGTVDRPVVLSIYQLSGQSRYPVLTDSLPAGTHTNRSLRQDFYSRDEVELQVSGSPATTGSLDIEWYRQ